LNLTTASYFNLADQSQDIASPLEGLVGGIAVPLGILLIGLLYWQFYRALKSCPKGRDAALIRSVLLVMLAFMITFRALPGHYLLAILPLAALVRFEGHRYHVFVAILLGALLLGQLETVVWLPLLAVRWVGIGALVARNSAILATFGVLLGGRMRQFIPALKSSARRSVGVRPKPSLGWTVESGVRSWQAVSAPFDAYREQAPSLLPMRHLYLDHYRQLLR
jgi:signal transduction histidine kinase